ncbi:MAG: hypothetical protein WBC04_11215 [Candidatus Acidiferrales bacterium]
MVTKRFAGLLLAVAAGLGSGWILRAKEKDSLAVVYYWKAKAGKLDEYNHYIKTVAEPVDAEARRHRVFVSVTTYISHNPDSPWTHMRVFLVRDREQAANLGKALDDTGARMQPDESKRKANQELAACCETPLERMSWRY